MIEGFTCCYNRTVTNFFTDIFKITNETVSGILTLGGTILGTSNIANPFKYTLPPFGTPEAPRDVSSVALHNFKERELDALITIGGDGTLHMSQQFVELGGKS